jgi:putative endonuclease
MGVRFPSEAPRSYSVQAHRSVATRCEDFVAMRHSILAQRKMDKREWFVYIVQCRNGELYTGVTRDITRRLIEHNTDDLLGSKFVRSRRPAALIYKEVLESKSDALKREHEIKSWSRKKKFALIMMG